jgi:nitroreductase
MSIIIDPSPYAHVADVITSRRTVKAFTGRPIEHDTLTELIDLAIWAPNHRLTNPWRFAILEQPAIRRLGDFLASEPAIAAVPDPAKGRAKLAKLLERLPGLGALIQVTWIRNNDPSSDLEDHAAASAAVQNLLLGATAMGLASFWSTTPALGHPATLRWCGLDPDKQGFLGAIWLGYASDEPPPPPPRKPVDEVSHFV